MISRSSASAVIVRMLSTLTGSRVHGTAAVSRQPEASAASDLGGAAVRSDLPLVAAPAHVERAVAVDPLVGVGPEQVAQPLDQAAGPRARR